ncbi:MAG: hypothetical protein KKF68_01225 [Nanoarchaeota archaeon]|nr:hypothetical protein [Nanoarchaeota archaeon]
MAAETILQHWIFTQFIFPFALIWAIVYGVLEKTKLLGDGKHQLNTIVALVIGLIFVGAIFPKTVVENLILFLTVAIVVMFVLMLLWGFAFSDKDKGFEPQSWMKWILWVGAGIAVVIAVIWATGVESTVIDFLFKQSWSESFWTNFAFIVVIAVALAMVLKKGAS